MCTTLARKGIEPAVLSVTTKFEGLRITKIADTVVAGRMVGEHGLELGGHQARIAGDGEPVLEAREQLVESRARRRWMREPRGNSSAERKRSGRRASAKALRAACAG